MAVREFNGTSDFIDFTLPGNVTGDFTVLAVVKRLAADTNWSALYSHAASGGTSQLTYEIEGSTGVQGAQSFDTSPTGGFSDQSANNLLSTDGWSIVGVTKTAGGTKPTFHLSKAGAAFSHTLGGSIIDNPGTQAGGKATVGRFLSPTATDFAHLRLAAMFVWVGTAVANATVDTLIGKTKTDFLALTPTAGWEFGQASTGTSVADLVASANQSAIGGTTVVTGDDPGSGVYTLASGATAPIVSSLQLLGPSYAAQRAASI